MATKTNGTNGKGFKLPKGPAFLLVAGVVALGLGLVVQQMSNKSNAPKAIEKTATEAVVVATQHLPIGTLLGAEHLRQAEWPKDWVSPGNSYSNVLDLIGKKNRTELFPGQLVYKQMLADEYFRPGLALKIPPGHRAITLGVDEVKGVAGFIQPGDRVDIIATFDSNDPASPNGGAIAQTVIEDALVLGVAQDMVDTSTLPMTPPEATRLTSTDPAASTTTSAAGTPPPKDANAGMTGDKKDDETPDRSQKGKVSSSLTLALTPRQIERTAICTKATAITVSLRPSTKAAVISSQQGPRGTHSDSIIYAGPVHKPINLNTAGMPPQPNYAQPAPGAFPGMTSSPMTGGGIEVIQGTQRQSVGL